MKLHKLPANNWFEDYQHDCTGALRLMKQLEQDEKDAVNQIHAALLARFWRCPEYFYERFAEDMNKPSNYMDFYKRQINQRQATPDCLALLQALKLWNDETKVYLRS